MLLPHSLLWHYLWLAPQALQLALAAILYRRGSYRQYPIFFSYLIFEAVEQFVLYGLDVVPSVSEDTWWLAFSVGLVAEGCIRLALAGELLSHLTRNRVAIARTAGRLMSVMGACLVLAATLAAAYTPIDSHHFALGYRAHLLQQTLYLIECGLIVFLFVFASFCHSTWSRAAFGIALGRGISSSVHLATWAMMANGGLSGSRYLLDFLNMATYHVCVLIWMYYLLVPQKVAAASAVSLPENDLELWNREVERLIQP
jgi:hypothetical protein